MKITITGFNNDPEVFTYTVQTRIQGTISGTSSMSRPVEKTITGEALNALSQQLPHSQPGQMTDEEILLASIHDMHYVDDGADLVGKSGRTYGKSVELPTPADLDYVQKVSQGLPRAVSPGRTPLFALTVGQRAYACYENHTGFPVYINDAEVAAYIADSEKDAKQWVRKNANEHMIELLR